MHLATVEPAADLTCHMVNAMESPTHCRAHLLAITFFLRRRIRQTSSETFSDKSSLPSDIDIAHAMSYRFDALPCKQDT